MTDLEKQLADLTLKVKVYERNYREAEQFRLKNLKLNRELKNAKEEIKELKKVISKLTKPSAQREARRKYYNDNKVELKIRRLSKCQS